jgi:3-oxoacyl-[acyl-carrier protein] reductase
VPIEIDLSGRVAFVTGGSRGLGRTDALTLARAGADVVLADILVESDTSGRLEARYGKLAQAARAQGLVHTEGTAAEIRSLGRRALALQCDVTDREQVDAAVGRSLEELGAIDILVNNAGVYEFAPLEAITPEHFHKHFDLNVLGLLLVSGEVSKHFNANGGSIINISSGVSTIAPANTAVYTATKASVDAISAVLAKELAPRKIRVNAVNPGMIATEGVVSAGLHEGDMRNWIESVTPLGRIGKAEEIAATVAFFASDEASYVTGETLHVTGGLR